MTQSGPRAIWSGPIEGQTFRVVDLGASAVPRVIVEQRTGPDALGGFGWSRYEPIPTSVFSTMLVAAGVIH